jgi:hypothetical protein
MRWHEFRSHDRDEINFYSFGFPKMRLVAQFPRRKPLESCDIPIRKTPKESYGAGIHALR